MWNLLTWIDIKHFSLYTNSTNLKIGCNLVSCKMRMGFLGIFVQNSSAKNKLIIIINKIKYNVVQFYVIYLKLQKCLNVNNIKKF